MDCRVRSHRAQCLPQPECHTGERPVWHLEFAFAPKLIGEIRPRLVEAVLDMVMWLTSRQKPAETEATTGQSAVPQEPVGATRDVPLMAAFRSTGTASRKVGLARVTVTDLGFPACATTREILGADDDTDEDGDPAPFTAGRGCELGLELCEPDVAPHLRLEYKDQPPGERLLVAMKPIRSSDGEPRIFVIEHNDQGLGLNAVRARADDTWQSDDIFVFSTGEE